MEPVSAASGSIISLTAGIIAILQLTSSVVDYLNDVHEAPRQRAQCAIEASNLFGILTRLKYRLETAGDNEPWYTAIRTLAVDGGPLEQYKSALEQLLPKVEQGSGIRRMGDRLVWKFSKERVKDILSRMERLKSLVTLALGDDLFKLSQAIKSDTSTIHDDNQMIRDDTAMIRKALPTLETGLETIQQGQNSQQHRESLAWISSTDFAAQQSDIISRRQEGTGVWFLTSPDFRSWLDGPNRTLFCPGIPGAGKTMVAAIAVDHLCNEARNEDVGVAYIFCNYKTQSEQTTVKLAGTILRQLVQQRLSVAKPLTELYNRHIGKATRPSWKEILDTLQPVLSEYSRVFVVIDALDEFADPDSNRTGPVRELRKLQSTGWLHLMVTSRFIPSIVEDFGQSLHLEIRADESDVKRFIGVQLHRLPKCVQRDNELQQTIREKISTAVDGM
ncbi:MAG: hypothetical protein Q9169_007902 [Polycauliona sp. 2 TL-2023]